MKTTHQIFFENSKNMRAIPTAGVDLVVTSPPYPMIAMWDECFLVEKEVRGDKIKILVHPVFPPSLISPQIGMAHRHIFSN